MFEKTRENTEFHGRKVAITGAASGIGRATAIAFARARARVWVCDLMPEVLPALEAELRGAGATEVHALCVDVGSAEQMSSFSDQVCASGAPDVLVNNAGVGLAGGLLGTHLDDWHWIVNVNLWGVVHGCHFFAPKMAERGKGQIINVASAAGFYNSEAMTAYGTTKYAVVGLSEALRAELRPRGVGVTVVCPGFVDTPIVGSMRLRGPAYPESERQEIQRFYRKRNYPPERVAQAVLHAVRQNPALLPVTSEAWALYISKRLAPDLSRQLIEGAQRFLTRRRAQKP